ncbi:unnamed protein product [Owenia fusiformis]|uniref:Uncharacterized protein n=1 Tax=Owenia fusiformis TaxID=6347 RepID=A0A8J1XJX8_OWEFU|nr:unnamed protein product [Owenia fusiformis]
MPEDKVIPVKVAVRCRPLITKETVEGCQPCLTFIPGEPQVQAGKNRAFTYDFVFSPNQDQEVIYSKAVQPLVKGVFKGYNATVLAYGQTGSGKTFTMGSAYNMNPEKDGDNMGVIPRVVQDLFEGINEQPDYDFVIKVSFLEIHNEDLHDLLSSSSKKEDVAIREDVKGDIILTGLTEVQVSNLTETITMLEQGSLLRTTGSTAMNNTSSRSHAIFTISVLKHNKTDSNDVCKSKFHLVDLAGSERVKRTRAEGARFKEGVNINMGLLALGNVISALGDEKQKRSHIPYRDSKLTRLLQDSLGGNSHTVMIACVSPADSNMEESINTLRYADRARKIKNKPVVNRDPQAAEILRLKQLVQNLQLQTIGGAGVGVLNGSLEGVDVRALRDRNNQLEHENRSLNKELQTAIDQSTQLCSKLIEAESMKEKLGEQIQELMASAGSIDALTQTDTGDAATQNSMLANLKEQLKGVTEHCEELHKTFNKSIALVDTEAQECNREMVDTPTQMSMSEEDKEISDNFAQRKKLAFNELQVLSKQLADKEQLLKNKQDNEENIDQIRVDYETAVKNYQEEIDKLTKEKDEMENKLEKTIMHIPSNKLSEQRRQKVKELEMKIAGFRKKLNEQSKLLKDKERSDIQISKLNTDIKMMKQHRVKLINQIKQENKDYTQWKKDKEKELTQLKAQDRKRQIEIVRMEKQHSKQAAVYKRKLEESAAINKRLKEATEKHRLAVNQRAAKEEKQEMSGVGNRIRSWLQQDLNMEVAVKRAQSTLDELIKDRKELTAHRTNLKQKLNKLPPEDDRKAVLSKELVALDQDLELRNIQIEEIQGRLADQNDPKATNNKWERIHTIVEAKVALKYLHNGMVTAKVHAEKFKAECESSKAVHKEASAMMDEAEKTVKNMKLQHENEMAQLQMEHEQKMARVWKAVISKQANTTQDEVLRQDLLAKEELLEKVEALQEQLVDSQAENKTLKMHITKNTYATKLMPGLGDSLPASPVGTSFFTPVGQAVKKRKHKAQKKQYEYMSDEDEIEDNSDEDVSDSDNDADWQPGLTPGFQQRHKDLQRKIINSKETKEKKRSGPRPTESEGDANQGNTPTERQKKGDSNLTWNDEDGHGSDQGHNKSGGDTKCSCKKGKNLCGTNHCGCVRKGLECGVQCKCDSELCKNSSSRTQSPSGSDSASTLNTTFDIGRPASADSAESTIPSSESVQPLMDIENRSEQSKRRSGKRKSDKISDASDTQNVSDTLESTILDGGLKKKKKLLNLNSGSSFFSPLA